MAGMQSRRDSPTALARPVPSRPNWLTASARRAWRVSTEIEDGVTNRQELARWGIGAAEVRAQVAAGRWQLVGRALVLHNGALTDRQRGLVALLNCGPHAVLTSFTAAAEWGLRGWERPEIHVLVPAYARQPKVSGVRLHRTSARPGPDIVASRRLHRLGPALLVAAASFQSPRPGCGLLATGYQQRLVRTSDVHTALVAAPRTRHRAALLLAVADIAQGAQALSEIDFERLCTRNGLPRPDRQAVRVEPSGRRRYLDADWTLPDGRLVGVEVDGAVHLAAARWFEDQLRHNEVVLSGTTLLRFPSVVVRHEPALVVSQLARLLALGR